MKKSEKKIDITALCDKALEMEREIKNLQDEQKKIEKEIRAFAKDEKSLKVPTDGGGWSVQLHCTDGSFVRVIKDGDTLKSKIDADDEDLPKVRQISGGAFDYLFTTRIAYPLIADFRNEAAKLLPEPEKLIELVTKCGKTSVTYQVAKTPEA